MNRLYFTIILSVMSTLCWGQRAVTYDSIASNAFKPKTIEGLRSMIDGEHYTAMRDQAIVRYRYSDGAAVDTIFNAASCTPLIKFESYQLSDDERMLLLDTERDTIYRHSFSAIYFVYDRDRGILQPLSSGGKQQEATISPNGHMGAFVRDNDLWVVELASGHEKRLTSDGRAGDIINGIPDWVYEEEYGFSRAYEWSPSSNAIAYYRFDERAVPTYNMNYFDTLLYPKNITFKYPKAGESNSEVQIRVVRIATNSHTTMDIGDDTDIYVPRIEWTTNSDQLIVHRLNRLQNRYDMLLCNAGLGNSTSIYSEISPTYVERIDDQKVTFLKDGKRFIVKNETDGWMHLYLYNMQGKKLAQLTRGAWEVTDICGVDDKGERVFYTSTELSPLGSQLYSVNFRGGGKRLLTPARGTNSISMSAGGKYFINHHSSNDSPTVARLHGSNGRELRVLEDNAALRDSLKGYSMARKEFFKFALPSGDTLHGYMMRPLDFDAGRKYPVFMTQYSGPGSQRVVDKWSISWESALPGEGYIVVCVDGRGTGGRGEAFRKSTYGNLGGLETQDQIAAARYIASLPYVDPARIGIYGWSFGGFMALNCILKGSDVFKMAIAVAPVTSWRFYDTIYTELYNGLPQGNARGYDENSPLHFADSLRGKLLIAHGTADDNVHVQNSYRMIDALLSANKGSQIEWLIYPDRNHGMGDRKDDLTYRMINFVKTNL